MVNGNIPPKLPAQTKGKAALVTAGISIVASGVFALVARSFGILSYGLPTFSNPLVAAVICFTTVLITGFFFKRKGRTFTSSMRTTEAIILSGVFVFLISWLDTRQQVKILLLDPPPSGIHVHHGGQILFSGYLHFSAKPETIAAIIKARELVSPAEDDLEYEKQKHLKGPFEWWQPASLSNPRLYIRHHQSEAVQGWLHGIWVNDKTNEAYVFIKG